MKNNGWDKRPRKGPSTCHPDRLVRAHGLCNACYLAQYRVANAAKLKPARREAWLKRKYNITSKCYDEMLSRQSGRCAICDSPPHTEERPLHVDHCHKTGAVRGLLCAACNWYVGKIERRAGLLTRLITYTSTTTERTT